MSIRKKERMNKISRLIEGGFDGSIGSERHHKEMQEDLRDKNFGPDSYPGHEDSYYSGQHPDSKNYSLLPYSSEGMLDEDIHIYILDENFFGRSGDKKSRAAALNAISFIFEPIIGSVSVQIGGKDEKAGGLRAKGDYTMSKGAIISNIEKIINDKGNFLKEDEKFKYSDKEDLNKSAEKLNRINGIKIIHSSLEYLVGDSILENISYLEKEISRLINKKDSYEDKEEFELKLESLKESLNDEKEKWNKREELSSSEEYTYEDSNQDGDYLSSDQIYFLEHLHKSLEASRLPFFLYIYDPIGPENISFNSIKHDAIHILNDKRSADKETVSELEEAKILDTHDNQGRKKLHNPQAFHNIGRAYMSLYQAFMGGSGLSNSILKLLKNAENISFKSFSDKAESVDLRSIFEKGAGHNTKMKHLILDFFKKYIIVRYKKYVDKNPFIDQTWTSDRFQDLFQAIVFNTITKGDLSLLSRDAENDSDSKKDRIIDFEIDDVDNLISDLNKALDLSIDENSTVNNEILKDKIIEALNLTSNKINRIFYNFIKELNDGKIGYKLYNQKADELLDEDDKMYKVVNEESFLEESSQKDLAKRFIENIKSKPKLDGLIRRRLRFLSRGNDVIFCFIRLKAKV